MNSPTIREDHIGMLLYPITSQGEFVGIHSRQEADQTDRSQSNLAQQNKKVVLTNQNIAVEQEANQI